MVQLAGWNRKHVKHVFWHVATEWPKRGPFNSQTAKYPKLSGTEHRPIDAGRVRFRVHFG
jgi:hypothetical protein